MSTIKDIDGKESSKRKIGMRLINIAIYMALIYFTIGILITIFDEPFTYSPPYFIEIWWTFMGTGAGLLGFTLVERFSKK